MYNCSSINFPCKENCYRLATHMKTAAWKNDPVEKLCNQHVKSMAWDKEKSESPEGIESMTFRTRVWCSQRAKKVVSDSPGLVDFAIGPVNSVFNLPDGKVMFYEEFE